MKSTNLTGKRQKEVYTFIAGGIMGKVKDENRCDVLIHLLFKAMVIVFCLALAVIVGSIFFSIIRPLPRFFDNIDDMFSAVQSRLLQERELFVRFPSFRSFGRFQENLRQYTFDIGSLATSGSELFMRIKSNISKLADNVRSILVVITCVLQVIHINIKGIIAGFSEKYLILKNNAGQLTKYLMNKRMGF